MLAVPIVLIAYCAPAFATPVLDSSWQITYYYNEKVDEKAARAVLDAYGGTLVAYDASMSENLNNWGQNILWIGGYAFKVGENPFPWLQTVAISKPSQTASVEWKLEDGAWKIYTPLNIYTCTTMGDFGTVTSNYDVVLHRYVVVVIGFDEKATESGAKLLIAESLPNAGGYIVYRNTGSAGQYEILESA